MRTNTTHVAGKVGMSRWASSLIVVVVAAFWMAGLRPAKAQVVLNCSVSPLLCPGLVVQGLSVYATMPDGSGNQQVTASFRVANISNTAAASSTTTVQWAGVTTTLATPSLAPYANAFVGTTITTALTDFTMTVTTGNGNSGSYHFVAASPALGRWRPIGPSVLMYRESPFGVGRITTIAIDGSTTGTVYAGARASGLWKTVDGGGHWEPLTDALPTTRIDAVAINSANPQNVFVATPAGIFSSFDGGHVWALKYGYDLQGRGNDGGAMIIRGFSPQFLNPATGTTALSTSTTALAFPAPVTSISSVVLGYLTTAGGLVASADAGVTWAPVLAGGAATSLDQDRANASHLLAAIVGSSPGAGSAVYETFTGGLLPTAWHRLQGCPGAALPPLPDGPSVGVWVAQSGTTQWISVKNGAQHDLWRSTSQSCLVNGSPEYGWQHIFSGNPCGGKSSAWSFLHADPTNPLIVYKAGVELCRSVDGGASFQQITGPHDDHHALVFHPLYPSLVYEGNDGGFYRSDDGGQSFAFDAVGLSVSEFLDTDVGGASPRNVLGSAQDNSISATDLTSPVWQVLDANGDLDRTTAAVDPLNASTQYSVGQAADHLTVIQNGVPASLDATGLPTGCISYTDYPPALYTQFIATSNSDWHLLTTVGAPSIFSADASGCDGGLWAGPPWRSIFKPSGTEVFTRITYDPGIGLFLAGGNLGSVYINFSPDAMANVWTAPLGAVTAIVPDPSRSANYFVALSLGFGAGRIFEIHSVGILQFGGDDITANLPAGMVLTLAANPFEPGVLYAGTRGQGVFRGVRSSTGQWRWSSFNNGMPVGANVTKLRVDPASGTIYASTLGRGEFALDTVQNIIY